MNPQIVTIGLDRSVADWAPEAKYVLRTMLRIGDLAWDFCWADGPCTIDIYYGPPRADVSARVTIPADRIDPKEAVGIEPDSVHDFFGVPCLQLPGGGCGRGVFEPARVVYPTDILAGGFWLLTGAHEPAYRRDRRDNIDLEGTAFQRLALFERPILSQQAEQIRRFLSPAPESPGGATTPAATLVLTHDVDYPEIIRWIEWARVIREHGLSGVRQIPGILSGRSHYWKFDAWSELAQRFGGHATFYFMARQGSLWQYATGTPDAFYDVRDRRFHELFQDLRDRGCEVGLHASYHAHRSVDTLASERATLEEAAGVPIRGVRHHYWHLDPRDPNETLRRHEEAGLQYDSSLAFEFFPGFRRGVCHPFRVWHQGTRRELALIELPPTWMDDHFHHRRRQNGIGDATSHARRLLESIAAVGGVAVLDYHVRGMNRELFPAYGPWLEAFLDDNLPDGFVVTTAADAVTSFAVRDAGFEARSRDRTVGAPPPEVYA